MSSSGIGPDGKIYCKHMEEAAKRRSNTSKHPDREFYCCKRRQSDPTKCDFWFWADQLPRPKSSTDHASNSSITESLVPWSSTSSTSTRPVVATPTRLVQKRVAPRSGPPETPRSRMNRMEDIEAGLKQREYDLSPIRHPGPPEEQGRASPSGDQTIPQPPSPVPTEVDSETLESQPHRTFSFLGLQHSPEPTPSTIGQQPSIPKKRRLTPPTEGIGKQPVPDALSFGSLSLTPPPTTRHVNQSDGPGFVPGLTRSRKGKEREGFPPGWSQDQAGFDGHSVESKEEDLLPLFTHPEDTSSTSSLSPTIAENVLDFTNGMKTRMKALSEYLDSFDITQASNSLQRIERQKIQYECRDRSQKMRMEELVAERDELATEVSRLKEAFERCEESSRIKDGEIARLRGQSMIR